MSYDLINTDPVIRTFTGKWINVFDPDPESIDIRDVAHALSFQCRFGGHLKQFYSVAQHSIWCFEEAKRRKLNRRIQLSALMHDASEAFLVDVPRPIKLKLPEYKVVEDELMVVIAEKYDFDWPLPKSIKDIDRDALQIEWDFLKVGIPQAAQLQVYSQSYAEKRFLEIFDNLKQDDGK